MLISYYVSCRICQVIKMNHIGQYCFPLVSFVDAEFKVYKRYMAYLRENKLRSQPFST